jgi:hypothetical protein
MNETTTESVRKDELKDPTPTAPRGRGRPRRRPEAFAKMETVSIEKPTLPDPRWMAEFIAAFLRAKR